MGAFLFGLIFLAIGGVVLYFDRRLVRGGQWTDAEVVELQPARHPANRDQWVYYPVVRFRTADGQEIVAKTRAGSASPRVRRGDRVRVVYQIGTRTDVAIDTIKGRGLVTGAIPAVIGLALIVLGIYQMTPHRAHGSTGGPLLLPLVGLSFLAGGCLVFYQDRRLSRGGGRADAEVVKLDKARQRDGGWTYTPVVRFRTADGAVMVARAKVGWNRRAASPGDRIGIRYQTSNPENVVIDTLMGRGLVVGAIAGIVGLGMLAYAVYAMAR